MKVMMGAVAAALVAAGCSQQTTEPKPAAALQLVQLEDTVRLDVGGMASLGPGALQLRFAGVSADSRCPIDAVCIWPGDAEVELDATIARMAWTRLELHSFLEPKQVEFRDYRIRLVEVGPARRAEETIRPDEYWVKVVVSSR